MKHIFTIIMTIFCAMASAQEALIDIVETDSVTKKEHITQHSWNAYEWVDTCTARYAVVHDWNGRCGIYNLVKHENITELEYRELSFYKMKKLDDGNLIPIFYAKKGHRKGIVSVGLNDDIMEITNEDDDMFYSLDSCKTIDQKMTKKVFNFLKDGLEQKENKGAIYGQALVMDTKTGQIKAWVAIEDKFGNGKFENTRLQKNQCSNISLRILISTFAMADANLGWKDTIDTRFGIDSIGGLCIKDHNFLRGGYGKITYKDAFKFHSNIAMAKAIKTAYNKLFKQIWLQYIHSPRELDAMTIAGLYNVIANNGVIIVPSVNSDSIRYDCNFPNTKQVQMCKEILKATLQEGGIGSKWTTKKVDLSGEYATQINCEPTLYDDNAGDLDKFYSDKKTHNYSQIIFTGYLPSDNPRYTICVTMDSKKDEISGKNISYIVNNIAEYLNIH